jgi:membrane protein
MLSVKTIAKCFYKALVDTINHDGIEHAGYLAFLAILAIFPFLVFFFAMVGLFGQSELGLQLINITLENNLIPSNILSALAPRVEEIASGPPEGLMTIAILGAIWTASSAVEGIRTTLNRAYRVATPPPYLWRRMMSIIEFFVLTVVMMVVTFVLIITPNLWHSLESFLHLEQLRHYLTIDEISTHPLWNILRYFTTLFVLFLVVMAAYLLLPNTRQKWQAVAPGAAVVVLAWFIAGTLLSAYLSNFPQINLIYGSLGGIIAALLFFYINAMIFIFGAEFNYALQKALGHHIEEKE